MGALVGFSQGTKDLVINEILVNNVNNYEDDYGHRVSWVEIFNNGYSRVNLASCFLLIETDQEQISYRIPKSDTRTSVAPQGYIVFYCEGTGTKGTLHTNFALDLGIEAVVDTTTGVATYPSQLVKLSLMEANGRDTISSVSYDLAEMLPDLTWGRKFNEQSEAIEFVELDSTTPLATNETDETLPNHEVFRQADPNGFGMSVTSMMVVLSALLCLYLLFRTVGKILVRRANKNKKAAAAASAPAAAAPAAVKDKNAGPTGEELAAIAMAFKMYEDDLHDVESTVLTINRVAKTYSPWNSKIYGITQAPIRR